MKRISTIKSIHDLIQKEFDIALPISSGTGLSIDDPIFMNVDIDYVHNEYVVLEYLSFSRFMEWQRKGQKLINYNDRFIDCLTITVSDLTDNIDNIWTENYYFDVTDCIGINPDGMVEMD